MMLNKRLLCGLLAVTTTMTTIAFTAPSSSANPAVRGTSSVVSNVRKVPLKLPKIRRMPKPPVKPYNNYCKNNPNTLQCPFHKNK
ncbi:MAG: hypothetical protein ACHBN1_05635 [Heteroscytonema crispum UTEX LB 1556]